MKKLLIFLPTLRRYRLRLLGLSLLMIAATLCEGLGVGLFFPLLDYISQGETFLIKGPSRFLSDALLAVGITPSPGIFIALLFSAITATLALKLSLALTSSRVYNPLMKDLRDEAFSRILDSHLFYFHAGSSAKLAQTLEDDVENVGQALNFAVLILSSVFSIAIYAVLIVLVSWKLTLLVAGLAALRYAVSGLFIHSRRRLGEENAGLRARLKSYLIAIYQGIDVVKTFGTERREAENFRALTGRIDGNTHALAANAARNSFFEGLLGDGLLCLIIYLAVSRLHVSGAALLTFLVVISRMIPKVTAINDARIRIAEYSARVAFLPEVLGPAGLSTLRWGSTPKKNFSGEIVFENVSFSYPGAEAPALAGINLKLAKNETLAVIGESGAGKSTLARLLLRLFDPASGKVTIDGLPLPDLRREDWTRLVGVVSQDTFIFDDTLENNVKYGAPGASEADFRTALKRSRCEEFVAALPQKERTRLGERGVTLSGGQRQRISIARAFLRRAPILILDEATSAMDAATEKLIQDSIEELAQDRTMIVIAHRFTTIRNADRIVVLEGGRIAETGTHKELMDQDKLYRRFHNLQQS